MLNLAHGSPHPVPDDLWSHWNLDPGLLLVVGVIVGVYVRGARGGPRRPRDLRRHAYFGGALASLALALLSPLEALSASLASAHMGQHVLIVLVAAPLLAVSAPGSTLLRGTPHAIRRVPGRVRRGARGRRWIVPALRHPVVLWLAHVATLWVWHSSEAYDAALDSQALHILEHVTFLVTAVLLWRVIAGGRASSRVPEGSAVLMVFGLALQSVFLSVLLTFANDPWYSGYASTTNDWGLDPLADQQLAGVIMWVPAGAIYVAAGLALLSRWIRTADPSPGEAGRPAEEPALSRRGPT